MASSEDFKLQILKDHVIPTEFFKPWKNRDGYAQAIARFVQLNQKSFDFLGITATISTQDTSRFEPTLHFATSQFVGVAPIRSAGTGKVITNIYVTGQYGEDLEELMTLMPEAVSCEYAPDLKLERAPIILPPIFIECTKYVEKYLKAPLTQWRKFESKIRTDRYPNGQTLWTEYALRSSLYPCEAQTFNNKRNIFIEMHPERKMLNYVLRIAIAELSRNSVPISVRPHLISKIDRLRQFTIDPLTLKTDNIPSHRGDNAAISELKTIANNILNGRRSESLAWRMDMAQFYEAYIQYLFAKGALMCGMTTENNRHIGITGSHPGWGIRYLEPDIIVRRDQGDIIVDAKYKSHIYNWASKSDELQLTFRHDLHQVLSYLSITGATQIKRTAILCYPFTTTFCKSIKINNNIDIILLGIPMKINKVTQNINFIADILSNCK